VSAVSQFGRAPCPTTHARRRSSCRSGICGSGACSAPQTTRGRSASGHLPPLHADQWLQIHSLIARVIITSVIAAAGVTTGAGMSPGVALATPPGLGQEPDAVTNSLGSQAPAMRPTQPFFRSGISAAASVSPLTWAAPSHVDGIGDLTSVSCRSESFCMAVDEAGYPDKTGSALAWNGTSWSTPTTIAGRVGLTSVSCGAASFCMAVSNGGPDTYSWNGASWSTQVAPTSYLDSVSCPSPTFCMAVAEVYGGGASFTWNGASWARHDVVAFDSYEGQDYFLVSVSCTSASFCIALDDSGHAFSWNGTSWSGPTAIDPNIGTQMPDFPPSVSCTSATFCMELGDSGTAVWNGTSWSAPSRKNPGAGYPLSVSCASASLCVALTGYFGLYASTWTGLSWSAATEIARDRYSPTIASVSCRSTSFCMAVDEQGDAIRAGPPRLRLAALGDSYSSGNGTPLAKGACFRSPQAWPKLLPGLVNRMGGKTIIQPRVDLLACSGAESDGRSTASGEEDLPAQVHALKGLRPAPTVITVTTGGDDGKSRDVGFRNVLTRCVGPDVLAVCDKASIDEYNWIKKNEPGILGKAYRSVRAADPAAEVFAIGYPHIFKRGYRCGLYATSDVDNFNSLTDSLNAAIRRAARAVPRVTYVSTADVFAGHELCSGHPWVVPPLTVTPTIGTHDWMHPTTAGQKAIAERVAKSIHG
jgi:lysophospholipase L1-like esterase